MNAFIATIPSRSRNASTIARRSGNRAFWISIPFILSAFADRTIPVAGHEVVLSLLMLALFVFSFLLMILFVPCTRRAGVFMTEPVEKP